MAYLISLLVALGLILLWLGMSRRAAVGEAILSLARSMDPSQFYGGIRPAKSLRIKR